MAISHYVVDDSYIVSKGAWASFVGAGSFPCGSLVIGAGESSGVVVGGTDIGVVIGGIGVVDDFL